MCFFVFVFVLSLAQCIPAFTGQLQRNAKGLVIRNNSEPTIDLCINWLCKRAPRCQQYVINGSPGVAPNVRYHFGVLLPETCVDNREASG